jgi:hypothetical protein
LRNQPAGKEEICSTSDSKLEEQKNHIPLETIGAVITFGEHQKMDRKRKEVS